MIEFRRRGSLCRKRAREMDMDKRIHLELRNRTPSDVSICQKYLCRSILLLCVYVYVRCGEALFFEGGRLGGVDLGVGLQMNCKVGGLKCHPSMFRLLPPPLPLVCVTTCACAPACASVGARVCVRVCTHWGPAGARVWVGENETKSSSELAAPMTLSRGKINERGGGRGLPPGFNNKKRGFMFYK